LGNATHPQYRYSSSPARLATFGIIVLAHFGQAGAAVEKISVCDIASRILVVELPIPTSTLFSCDCSLPLAGEKCGDRVPELRVLAGSPKTNSGSDPEFADFSG
jgi:hypothetical protein